MDNENHDMASEYQHEEITPGEAPLTLGMEPEQPQVHYPTETELGLGGEEPIIPHPEVVLPHVDNPMTDHYNESHRKGEPTFGSCDCRSECNYNTGHTHKYASYGYSD